MCIALDGDGIMWGKDFGRLDRRRQYAEFVKNPSPFGLYTIE